jgi:hypothetical protein
MRKFIILIMSLAIIAPCDAATHSFTVEQLKQKLTAQQTAGNNDGSCAQQLNSLKLTEQLTQPTLDRITAEFKPGPKTALSLKMLADFSAFLEPPAGELLDKAPPEIAVQQAMLKSAINFVGVTLHQMPDFLATRLTDSYDDIPESVTHSGWAPQTDLHLAASFSNHITYRNGQEVLDLQPGSPGAKLKNDPSPVGLVSFGEFGPALGTTLTDASKGALKWSHWEQSAAGPVAVFHYEVPPAASHYWVNYCCVRGSQDTAAAVAYGIDAQAASLESDSYHGTPGYHGNLYLEPATGAVLRVTIESELKRSDPIMRAAVSVQYGPVEIDGKSYICPVRSLAISLVKSHARGDMSDREIQRINEVSFSSYHRFGSTSRIIVDGPAQ